MWDLSSPNRDWTVPCAGEVWSLNHWTTREVPCSAFRGYYKSLSAPTSLPPFPFPSFLLSFHIYEHLFHPRLSMHSFLLSSMRNTNAYGTKGNLSFIECLPRIRYCANLFTHINCQVWILPSLVKGRNWDTSSITFSRSQSESWKTKHLASMLMGLWAMLVDHSCNCRMWKEGSSVREDGERKKRKSLFVISLPFP